MGAPGAMLEQPQKPLTRWKRVLIVEDDLHSREGLRAALTSGGYCVETAGDGLQALQKIWEGLFEVAIIDVDLPPVYGVVMSGWDLVRVFRGYDPALAIIVVSAEDGPAARGQARQLKVTEFLEKPVSPAQLKALIKMRDP